MIVSFRAGTRKGTVEFPGEGCKGRLTLKSHDVNGQYTLHETIYRGARCIKQGGYTMYANDRTLVMVYIPMGKWVGVVSANATLIRTSP